MNDGSIDELHQHLQKQYDSCMHASHLDNKHVISHTIYLQYHDETARVARSYGATVVDVVDDTEGKWYGKSHACYTTVAPYERATRAVSSIDPSFITMTSTGTCCCIIEWCIDI
jgi:hypothetical protein